MFLYFASAALLFNCCLAMAVANVPDGKYYIINVVTNRRILSTGTIVYNRGDKKGYADAPKIVGADKDHENRATWQVTHKSDGKYFLENVKTLRYVLQGVLLDPE